MSKKSEHEHTSDELISLFPFSEKESIFFQNSPQNSLSLDCPSINFPLNFDEFSSDDDQDRYYIKNTKTNELENKGISVKRNNSNSGSSTTSVFPNASKEIFKTIQKSDKDPFKKFAGRKRKNPSKNYDEEKMHDKFSQDNVTRKIQIHVMNSLIQYVNEIVSKIDLGLEHIPVFNKIDYSFKKNITKKIFEENKKKTIENLIEREVSSKFKKFSRDSNKRELEKIKNNEIIKNILSQKYIDYFREVYYKNERSIDLSKYGLKKIINLSKKVKLYEDIFKGKVVDEKYRDRVEEIIKERF